VIAKVIPAKNGGRGFGTLVDYVTAETRLARPRGRDFDRLVQYVGRETSVDPSTGEAKIKAVAIQTHRIRSLETAAAEMQAVAEGCTRLRAPADSTSSSRGVRAKCRPKHKPSTLVGMRLGHWGWLRIST